MAGWMGDSSFLRSLIFTEAKWLYSLQLYSQVDWAGCFLSHQILGGNETPTHYSLAGVMGRPLRNGLVAIMHRLHVMLCSGGITGVLQRPNYLWFKSLLPWLILIHARLPGAHGAALAL